MIRDIRHPLIQHKLTILRRKETSSAEFRHVLREISMLLADEVTRDMAIKYEEIETPLTRMKAPVLEEKKPILVSVLRAGYGLLEGMLDLIPTAKVGHIGLARDEETLQPKEYYCKLPNDTHKHTVIVVDPMLATGNSAIAAVDRVKKERPKAVKFMCLLAAPEGIEKLTKAHPDVVIYTAAIDERLNEKGYIVPGLGDAGDRLFGTA